MKPGSRVICINSEFNDQALEHLSALPKEGKEYIVRDIIPDPAGESPAGITLEGLVNPKGWTASKNGMVIVEFHFRADRFRVKDKYQNTWDSGHFNLKQPLYNSVLRN
jgi:hypothetical protein